MRLLDAADLFLAEQNALIEREEEDAVPLLAGHGALISRDEVAALPVVARTDAQGLPWMKGLDDGPVGALRGCKP